jgi:hypothetical protein
MFECQIQVVDGCIGIGPLRNWIINCRPLSCSHIAIGTKLVVNHGIVRCNVVIGTVKWQAGVGIHQQPFGEISIGIHIVKAAMIFKVRIKNIFTSCKDKRYKENQQHIHPGDC